MFFVYSIEAICRFGFVPRTCKLTTENEESTTSKNIPNNECSMNVMNVMNEMK